MKVSRFDELKSLARNLDIFKLVMLHKILTKTTKIVIVCRVSYVGELRHKKSNLILKSSRRNKVGK